MHTDFAPARYLYLIYPEEVNEPHFDYTSLAAWYDYLLTPIPPTVEVVLLVKTRCIAEQVRARVSQPLSAVINSELRGIWPRDYAGFAKRTELVNPS